MFELILLAGHHLGESITHVSEAHCSANCVADALGQIQRACQKQHASPAATCSALLLHLIECRLSRWHEPIGVAQILHKLLLREDAVTVEVVPILKRQVTLDAGEFIVYGGDFIANRVQLRRDGSLHVFHLLRESSLHRIEFDGDVLAGLFCFHSHMIACKLVLQLNYASSFFRCILDSRHHHIEVVNHYVPHLGDFARNLHQLALEPTETVI
mmetsp:Transcript_4979/g.17298  ORF Transcript_4979/g.17298 Transcript_4979/m.17298 type:complete len:213 (-) Transcript_4979:40-678(-)